MLSKRLWRLAEIGLSRLRRQYERAEGASMNSIPVAQIAEPLVVSPRTVNPYLRAIYSKLDVTTRTAAARVAVEHKTV